MADRGRFYPGNPTARGGRDYDADFRTARPGWRRRRYLMHEAPVRGWIPEECRSRGLAGGYPVRGTRSYDLDYGRQGGGPSEYSGRAELSGGPAEYWHRGPYRPRGLVGPEMDWSAEEPRRGESREPRRRWLRDPYSYRGGGRPGR